MNGPRIAVVIPCFRVSRHILDVLARIGPDVERIYVVDDACPEGTGDLVGRECTDRRVRVIRNERNLGVGGAVKAGYRRALEDEMDIVVKLDGDGQMPPERVLALTKPLRLGAADYTKGNRFYSVDDLKGMPAVRVFGNAVLSFMAKLSSGYWRISDPTNGFTAIHRAALSLLPLEKVSDGYFFETDLLFRLAIARAVTRDVPMPSVYGDERSGLRVRRVLLPFVRGHVRNFCKRILYNYFVRDFSVASLELGTGGGLVTFSGVFGPWAWIASAEAGRATPAGTVMLAALPAILGVQLLLSFLSADIASEPSIPLQSLHP